MGKGEVKLNDKKMNLDVICSIVYNVKCLSCETEQKKLCFSLVKSGVLQFIFHDAGFFDTTTRRKRKEY